MLNYKRVDSQDFDNWNRRLLDTDASFFQYPYYGAGYDGLLPNTGIEYFELYENENLIGFMSNLVVNFFIFKIGLVLRGPVIIKSNKSIEILKILKQIQKENGYFFLRVNPNIKNNEFLDCLRNDSNVMPLDPFPIYKGSQSFDFVVHKKENHEELVQKYKPRARQALRYAEEEEFEFIKSNSVEDLKVVYDMFLKVSGKKEFSYRALLSYENILNCGKLQNLCTLYFVRHNGTVVNAAIIVKDRDTYNYFSGGLIEGDYRPRNSPSILLHHRIMQDCFFSEDKTYYNISYTSPDHPVYLFKSAFNPEVIPFPEYFTITDRKRLVKLFVSLFVRLIPRVKRFARKMYGNKK